jgi:hypothetical protein
VAGGRKGTSERCSVVTSKSMTGALCFSWISLAKTAVILSFFRLSTGVMVNRNTRTCRNTISRLRNTNLTPADLSSVGHCPEGGGHSHGVGDVGREMEAPHLQETVGCAILYCSVQQAYLKLPYRTSLQESRSVSEGCPEEDFPAVVMFCIRGVP